MSLRICPLGNESCADLAFRCFSDLSTEETAHMAAAATVLRETCFLFVLQYVL